MYQQGVTKYKELTKNKFLARIFVGGGLF
jgi:hypothetical protein